MEDWLEEELKKNQELRKAIRLCMSHALRTQLYGLEKYSPGWENQVIRERERHYREVDLEAERLYKEARKKEEAEWRRIWRV